MWDTQACHQSQISPHLPFTHQATHRERTEVGDKAGSLPWNATWPAWGCGQGGEVQLSACCVTSGLQAAPGSSGSCEGQYFQED